MAPAGGGTVIKSEEMKEPSEDVHDVSADMLETKLTLVIHVGQ